jgi:hypothetical protein
VDKPLVWMGWRAEDAPVAERRSRGGLASLLALHLALGYQGRSARLESASTPHPRPGPSDSSGLRSSNFGGDAVSGDVAGELVDALDVVPQLNGEGSIWESGKFMAPPPRK